jgi:hypothetical protein
MRTVRALLATLVMLSLPPTGTAPASVVPPPGAPNCPVFPANSVWHANVSGLPVHPRNDSWLDAMGGPSVRLHPDFGPSGGQPYGIPYIVVPGSHHKVAVDFYYPDESDPGPYPFGPDTPIEGGSDRHALMVDRDACVLYELYDAEYMPGGSVAGSGAIFDLRSNALRPAGWTSADAAGLPIFAGLIRRDEVEAGVIDHAIRVTAEHTDQRYIWPARHQAGEASDPNLPPMGARFRLKATFDVSGFLPETQVILRAMKRYGLMLADNGSNWFFGGTSEHGWTNEVLDELKSVPAGAFQGGGCFFADGELDLGRGPSEGEGPAKRSSRAKDHRGGAHGERARIAGSSTPGGTNLPPTVLPGALAQPEEQSAVRRGDLYLPTPPHLDGILLLPSAEAIR